MKSVFIEFVNKPEKVASELNEAREMLLTTASVEGDGVEIEFNEVDVNFGERQMLTEEEQIAFIRATEQVMMRTATYDGAFTKAVEMLVIRMFKNTINGDIDE